KNNIGPCTMPVTYLAGMSPADAHAALRDFSLGLRQLRVRLGGLPESGHSSYGSAARTIRSEIIAFYCVWRCTAAGLSMESARGVIENIRRRRQTPAQRGAGGGQGSDFDSPSTDDENED